MADICKKCGAEISPDNKFCMVCGEPVGAGAEATEAMPQQAAPQAAAPVTPQAAAQQTTPPVQPTAEKTKKSKKVKYIDPNAPGKDSKYEPISTGGYIGIALLMAIPVLGFILTIIWACGGCRKVCKRNFAKAVLIMLAIGIVIAIIAGLLLWPQISALKESLAEVGGLGGLSDLGEQLGQLGDLSGQLNELQEAAGAANAG